METYYVEIMGYIMNQLNMVSGFLRKNPKNSKLIFTWELSAALSENDTWISQASGHQEINGIAKDVWFCDCVAYVFLGVETSFMS